MLCKYLCRMKTSMMYAENLFGTCNGYPQVSKHIDKLKVINYPQCNILDVFYCRDE